jgi:hypothetical protein
MSYMEPMRHRTLRKSTRIWQTLELDYWSGGKEVKEWEVFRDFDRIALDQRAHQYECEIE